MTMDAASSLATVMPVSAQNPNVRHIAIIMDGNGRWAAAQNLPRVAGHQQGVKALQTVIEAAIEHHIEYLTVFAFSSENWRRPPTEVQFLMHLLHDSIHKELPILKKNGVRLRIIGNRDVLPPKTRLAIEEAESQTCHNKRLTLILAISYGARQEIAQTARNLAARVQRGEMTVADITPEMFESHLETAGIPDPDLLIRTSGEQRISNFLLWQLSYTEFMFMDVFWPDFSRDHFVMALDQFTQRHRRFGRVATHG